MCVSACVPANARDRERERNLQPEWQLKIVMNKIIVYKSRRCICESVQFFFIWFEARRWFALVIFQNQISFAFVTQKKICESFVLN